MEHIAPSLKYLNELIFEIENGISVKDCLIKINSKGLEFSKTVNKYLFCRQNEMNEPSFEAINSYQKTLLELIFSGILGAPILKSLKILRNEMVDRAKDDIEEHLAKIPFKLMIPLLLFQFPAYLILLFVPILKKFIEGLNS